jgi:(E)-4-hydroxy-3-methylbut-2-enyl-diphosphate synthase
MSRYGDTPLGMVESAMEFLRICELYNYDQVVLSMKASNPQVMVQAYRLLAAKMMAAGKIYPMHLGVTEAGEGEDGRVKSAQGIGALLMDGIGDTVRVSLTEEPEYESPVAKFLVDMWVGNGVSEFQVPSGPAPEAIYDPFAFNRRDTHSVLNMGNHHVPRVIADSSAAAPTYATLADCGYQYVPALDKYNLAEMAADFIYTGAEMPAMSLPGGLKRIADAALWQLLRDKETVFPLWPSPAAFASAAERHSTLNFIAVDVQALGELQGLDLGHAALVVRAEGSGAGHAWRYAACALAGMGVQAPVVLHTSLPEAFPFYNDDHLPEAYRLRQDAKQQLFLAGISGAQFVDGLADGMVVSPGNMLTNRTTFGIFQASRLRITKTEYISCPSCGRTLFDLQETTARIRKRTEHLKGIKIGIMGCIVNGPGEMADADYGYVGVGPDKIALYRGKEVVHKGVKTAEAVDRLIDLIAGDGNWIDQP